MAAPRTITVAAAQMGGNQPGDSRTVILDRMLKLMDQAAEAGVRLLAFPELALTTFFPMHYMTNPEKIGQYFDLFAAAFPQALSEGPYRFDTRGLRRRKTFQQENTSRRLSTRSWRRLQKHAENDQGQTKTTCDLNRK